MVSIVSEFAVFLVNRELSDGSVDWPHVTPCRNFSNFFLKNDNISNFCSHFSIGVYEKMYFES